MFKIGDKVRLTYFIIYDGVGEIIEINERLEKGARPMVCKILFSNNKTQWYHPSYLRLIIEPWEIWKKLNE